ncbi:MAG: hypothetical protein K0U74_01995 [Alphaproteobacteria bacterium]|nr:hypothetical protein [Alphaproteobacteria bacterium]
MQDTMTLTEWETGHDELFGNHVIKMQHRLADTGLFTIDSLAEIIERIPSENYNLNTMGFDYDNPQWREGRIGRSSGRDVIDAIRRGRMWLNLRRLQQVDPRFDKLLEDIMAEFQDNVPGLKTFKHELGILISSPKVRVFYHADIPGQSLWQISGRKRVYIYPNGEPFLKRQELEKVVLGMQEEEVTYHDWFDNYAEVHDLEPGDMATWPLNAPHQVINADSLNISVTTQHWTSEIRNAYAVNYANGVLRNAFGYRPRVNKPIGLQVYPKAALALAWKSLNLQKAHKLIRTIDFELDPNAETGMRDLEEVVVKA